MNKTLFSTYLLRFHGTIAIAIGTALAIFALRGYYSNTGLLQILSSNTIGFIGMIQSYGFMIVFGFLMWLGSYQEIRMNWHLVGLSAHLVPFLGNIIFWDLAEQEGLGHNAVILHLFFISIEFYAFFLLVKSKRNLNKAD